MNNEPETFQGSTTTIFHNMNIILDNITKRIESLNGAARFLHSRMNELEDRVEMLEKVSVRLVNESGKKLFIDEEFKKKVSSKTIFLGSEEEGVQEENGVKSCIQQISPKPMRLNGSNPSLPSEKPERKYKKKYPNRKLGRPKKIKPSPKLEPQYKVVYNPDIDEMKTGIE